MLYTIAIQNLRLQVSIPDSADTAVLDKVVREFNDHLMTFNGGRPVKLFESKEVRLLIFTLISFILGLQKKQEELEEGLKEKPVHVSTKESEKVSNRNDSETIETIKKTNFPLRQGTYEPLFLKNFSCYFNNTNKNFKI